MKCRRAFASMGVACALLLLGCAGRRARDAAAGRTGERRSSVLEEGVTLFTQCRFDEAVPLLERAAEEDGRNPAAHEWLAAGYFRQRRLAEADAAARRALELDRCSSRAHAILAVTYNPQYSPWQRADADSTWHHLHEAIACDSSNGDAWTVLWSESLRRGRLELADEALRAMVRTGFLTKALLAYNRWMLRHLPENALVMTNGDMDTYPAVAIQAIEGFRRDVVIVNRSLLNTTWYPRYIRNHRRVPLPFADAELDSLRPVPDAEGEMMWVSRRIFNGWVEMVDAGDLGRPIAVATTVPPEYCGARSRDFVLCGAYRRFAAGWAEGATDTAAVRISLASIDPDDFSGSFVSELDHSPVRITHSNALACNVTVAALQYAMALLKAGRAAEAYDVLTWAEEFEKGTAAGPVHAERIAQFKTKIKSKMESE